MCSISGESRKDHDALNWSTIDFLTKLLPDAWVFRLICKEKRLFLAIRMLTSTFHSYFTEDKVILACINWIFDFFDHYQKYICCTSFYLVKYNKNISRRKKGTWASI